MRWQRHDRLLIYNNVDREKAIGLFKLRLVEVFTPFHGYGQDIFVPEAQQHILEIALRLHYDLKGERSEGDIVQK